MKIYCCKCDKDIIARLTNGAEIYPHRKDLHLLPFWKCDECNNHVGCHHKTIDRVRPLGVIPSEEIKKARMMLHRVIDPIWQSKMMTRRQVYKNISDLVGWNFHTAEIRTMDQARMAYKAAKKIAQMF